MDLLSRFKGSLLGLACGDALGVTQQYQRQRTFAPISDMVGGGSFCLQAGQWTDDTATALCLACSLLEAGGFDPKDQLQRYLNWWRTGYMSCTKKCFDIGSTTSAALMRFSKTNNEYCGADRPHTAGNASLVRLTPVVLYFHDTPETALKQALNSSRTTHASPLCLDACRLFAGLLLGALQGRSKEEILAPDYEPIPGCFTAAPLDPAVNEVRRGGYKQKQASDIRGNGYVIHSLEAALWAFYTSSSFSQGVLKAVNLGEDATSTGALFGQLAGAYYGVEQIPPHWIERLAQHQFIETTAERLFEKSRH
jgi:ADP-ribosylglycohydrolase